MIAISVLLSWEVIALAVVGVILFYKVIDLAAENYTQWRAAARLAEGEDLTANRERKS